MGMGSSEAPTHHVLAIVTDDPIGSESLREIRSRKGGPGEGVDLRVVVPAIEPNVFRHTLGDVDEPRREAEARLDRVLAELQANGIDAAGEVGDSDPIQAAQDVLLKEPMDEILIFEHERAQARWFEDGLMERAEAGLDPPLRMVVVQDDEGGDGHVVDIETAGPGTRDPNEDHEIGSAYLPGLTRSDFAGMVAGIVGTILAAVLAAVVTAENGVSSGRAAAAILIAIGVALINMAHVVGLTLMESVRYQGGFARLFRYLSLIGTPTAVLAILVILVI
jgi:hypothetical protein